MANKKPRSLRIPGEHCVKPPGTILDEACSEFVAGYFKKG